MKFYIAPLEGITGYIYRNAHQLYFKGADKYFTPFIASTTHGKFSSREQQDTLPAHNKGVLVVPQILTNNAEDFLLTVQQLQALGYKEVNLNLGCPSGTVVAKNKGAGFLAVPDALDAFLEEIYHKSPLKISIKTRIGKASPEEFSRLLEIYKKYPLEELIIHPRVQTDYYKNKPNLECFGEAVSNFQGELCYNGDLFTVDAYKALIAAYPQIDAVMLGRGVIANPALIEMIKGEGILDKERFKAYHDHLYKGYQEVMSGDRNTLFKMKESWYYMIHLFEDPKKIQKRIRKAQTLKEYEAAIDALFETHALTPFNGFSFPH